MADVVLLVLIVGALSYISCLFCLFSDLLETHYCINALSKQMA